MKTWKIVFGLLIFVHLIVCSKKSEDAKDTGPYTTFEDSTIVAKVNDETITFQDVEDAARQIIFQTGLATKVDPKDSVIQQQALDWLIANTLLKQEAKKYTIEVKDDEVEAAINQLKKNFPTEEKFNEALQQEKLSMRQFRENIVVELKVQKLLEQQVISQMPEIGTDEAKEYYEDNLEKFKQPTKARARHILFKVPDDASETEIANIRQKAESVLTKLKQGQNFEELASKYSDGPAAKKGGDLGFFNRGDMLKEFDEVVFSLQPGAISNVVRTALGFHIIKLEELKEADQLPFEKVEDDIKNFLKNVKSQQQFEDYINKLKQKSKIQINSKIKYRA